MPKKSKGGKKGRKFSAAQATVSQGSKALDFKGEGQEYGIVLRCLGSKRFEVKCYDGVNRTASLPGSWGKGNKIISGDLVIIEPWASDTKDDKCSILHKYTPENIRMLINLGEIKSNFIGEQKIVAGESDASGSDSEEEVAFDESYVSKEKPTIKSTTKVVDPYENINIDDL
jgi:translation initiation factor 1A